MALRTVFQTDKTIHQTSLWTIHRGIRLSDQTPVLIKTPCGQSPGSAELNRIKNDYEVGKYLNHENILAYWDLLSAKDGLAIIAEGFEGESLEMKGRQQPLETERLLPVLTQLAKALAEIHNRRFIHGSITLDSFLIDPASARIKLVDFSFASRFDREIEFNSGSFHLAEQLPFLSPEQTGRMNRPIDFRTDFYSLGVVAYVLATGRLPFDFRDPAKLIHAHLAQHPISPQQLNSTLPESVSKLIMKLLAKDIEDRYQSASGLLNDIDFLARGSSHSKASFIPGKNDTPAQLRLSQKFYGRDETLERVLREAEQLDFSARRILFLSGPAGIGKSFLLKELRRLFSLKQTRVVCGNYERTDDGIPFLGLIEALRQAVRSILTEPDAGLEDWRNKLRDQLGDSIQTITGLIPELESLLPGQQARIDLESEEIRLRFPLVLTEFVTCLCRPSMPLVLILDNLHLADAASFRLLESILMDRSLSNFIFVAAYESEGARPDRNIERLKQTLQKEGIAIQSVSMSPLGVFQLTDFINDSFRCGVDRAFALAEVVLKKTAGNPQTLKQFLMRMVGDGHIRQEEAEGSLQWLFDLKAIEQQGATENVADYLVSQLEYLEQIQLDLLKTASCWGIEFNRELLLSVHRIQQKALNQHLESLVNKGILLAIEKDKDRSVVAFRFAHARLKSAVYEKLEAVERPARHYEIGKMALASQESMSAEKLFQTVNQLNAGYECFESNEDRLELAKLNLEAGRKSKQSNIHESAIWFFERGLAILSELNLPLQPDLFYQIKYELAGTYYAVSDFDQLETLLKSFESLPLTQQQRVDVWGLKIDALIARNMMSEALSFALACLDKLDFAFPANPGKLAILYQMKRTEFALARREADDILQLPRVVDEEKILILSIIRKTLLPAFFVHPLLFTYISLKMTRLALKWGNSEECIFYAYYGLILCGVRKRFEEGYTFAKMGVQLIDSYPTCKNRAATYYVFESLVRVWKDPMKRALDGIYNCYRLGLETGYKEIAANSLYSYGAGMLYSGVNLPDVEKTMAANFLLIRQQNHQSAIHLGAIYQQTVHNLMGKSREPLALNHPYFDESTMVAWYFENNDGNSLVHYFCGRCLLLLLFGEHESLVADVARFKPYMKRTVGFVSHVLINLAYAISLLSIRKDKRDGLRERRSISEVRAISRFFKQLAEVCPENYLNKYHLIEAELNRFVAPPEAMTHYRKSIQYAGDNGFIHEQALACERYALFWIEKEQHEIATLFFYQARDLYQQWGAMAKVKAMKQDDRFGMLISDRSESAVDASDLQLTHLERLEQVDVETILRAIQAVSGEMMTRQLLAKILRLIIEHSGAEFGFIIRNRDRRFDIEQGLILEDNDIIPLKDMGDKSEHSLFSRGVVAYVLRCEEMLVLNDACQDSAFSSDPHVARNRTKSLLCAPFSLREEVYGVIYLENNLSRNVFTQRKVDFIRTLLSQAAVSMENAMLYEKTVSTQKKLAMSEEKYKLLVENTGAIVMHLSLDGVILFINSFGAKLFDKPSEELIGKSIRHLSSFFNSTFKSRVDQLVQSGEGASFKDFIDLPAGEFWFYSSYQPVKDDEENAIAIQVTSQDITGYKSAEEELQRLSTILEETSDFVCVCQPDMSVQYVNRAGMEMVGLSDHINLVNLELKDFYPKWAMKQVNSNGIPAAIDKGIWSGETAMLHFNGEEIPVSQVIMAHRSETGKLQYISTIARDISEQKEHEAKLKEYQQQLELLVSERTNQLKEVQDQLTEKAHKAGVAEIAAGTLHNVGNLLNSIKTSASSIDTVLEHSDLTGFLKANELLRDNMDRLAEFISDDGKGRKLMQYYLKLEESLVEETQSIKREVKRLHEKIDVISDVITAQQSYAGLGTSTEAYSLELIIEDALTLESGLIDRYGINIIKQYQQIPPVLIQKTKLIHVLINLINNARDAMLDLPKEKRVLTIIIEPSDGMALLKIKDSGKGIPKEQLGKIFTHGFTTKKGGHGFGLHSSAGFISEMDGNIRVESDGAGKGATFIVELPTVSKALAG